MSKNILVIPGTGKQGRAATRILLERGYSVHNLVRNVTSDSAKELARLGAILHNGDLSRVETIEDALDGIDTVFFAIPAHPIHGTIFAKNIIDAAKRKGVKTMIHTSVARTGEHKSFPGWSDDYPLAWYWKDKQVVEDMVRDAGFENWTIFRPAFFVQNFAQPEVSHMFPGLADSQKLRVAYHADTKLDLIDTETIARFIAAACDSPATFSGKEIALAAEKLTAAEMAERLGAVTGKRIEVELVGDEDAERLIREGHVSMAAQLWHREVGYGVDVGALEQYGVPLMPFSDALKRESLGW